MMKIAHAVVDVTDISFPLGFSKNRTAAGVVVGVVESVRSVKQKKRQEKVASCQLFYSASPFYVLGGARGIFDKDSPE